MTPIRPATTADIPALHALIESAYRGDSARAGWTHEADLLGGQRTDQTLLAEALVDPQSVLLVNGEGGRLSGCVQVTKVAADRCYLGMLTVDPATQSQGLGRRLMAAAETEAADRFGASVMEMTVIRQRGELIAYYERRGYVLTGEMRPFPLDDERFGLPKTRELEFVVLEKQL